MHSICIKWYKACYNTFSHSSDITLFTAQKHNNYFLYKLTKCFQQKKVLFHFFSIFLRLSICSHWISNSANLRSIPTVFGLQLNIDALFFGGALINFACQVWSDCVSSTYNILFYAELADEWVQVIKGSVNSWPTLQKTWTLSNKSSVLPASTCIVIAIKHNTSKQCYLAQLCRSAIAHAINIVQVDVSVVLWYSNQSLSLWHRQPSNRQVHLTPQI